MKIENLTWAKGMSEKEFVSRLDAKIDALGLIVTLRGTLKSHPGSMHWHLKRGKEPGVLEITYLPAEKRAWLSVHDNRDGEWVARGIEFLL